MGEMDLLHSHRDVFARIERRARWKFAAPLQRVIATILTAVPLGDPFAELERAAGILRREAGWFGPLRRDRECVRRAGRTHPRRSLRRGDAPRAPADPAAAPGTHAELPALSEVSAVVQSRAILEAAEAASLIQPNSGLVTIAASSANSG